MNEDYIHTVRLTGEVGLKVAKQTAVALREALAGHRVVAVATDEISVADITTIQVLLAAKKHAEAVGRSFALAAPPDGVLLQLLIRVGILDAGGLPCSADDDFWTTSTLAEGKAA